jgi:hypothetical protein
VSANALLVEPAFHWSPGWVWTLGDEVADLAALAGFPPDPEQRVALDDMFGVDEHGRSVFEMAVIAPRQNIKTGLFKQAALGWLFLLELPLVVWSAHEFSTAQEAFRDLQILIESTPELDRRVRQVHLGAGQEGIELAGNVRIRFKARTRAGGRGLTGNRVVLDEGLALMPSHMGALMPTLSAVPDPQLVYGSSAGLASSAVLRSVRDRGRRGGDPTLAYWEWCDDLGGGCAQPRCSHVHGEAVGCRLDDQRRWGRANSQLGRRIAVSTVAAERRSMPAAEFARERAGWWDDPAGEAVIADEVWSAGVDLGSQVAGELTFAVDVSPDRSWSTVAVAGYRADGLLHVEVTSSGGTLDSRPGADWVGPRVRDLLERWPGSSVSIAAGSPAVSLKRGLEATGAAVDVVPSGDVAAACGLFYDLATGVELRHLGQPVLADAIRAARRSVDDGETAWRWGRRRSDGDITPLYAATLAVWAADRARHADYDIDQSIY